MFSANQVEMQLIKNHSENFEGSFEEEKSVENPPEKSRAPVHESDLDTDGKPESSKEIVPA